MKKYALLLSSLLFIFACNKKDYYNIPAEDIFKYKVGDMLYYKSNLSRIDSFKIALVSKSYDVFDKVDYVETQYVNLKNDSVKIGYSTNHIHSSINWYDLYFSVYPDSFSRIEYSLGKTLISRVYQVSKFYNSDQSQFSTIYFTCKYGVIRYDKKDGEYYELQLK